MDLTVDEIFTQALRLPDESKETLVERLLTSMVTQADPAVELEQLEVAKRRRDEVRSGQIQPLAGGAVMAEARRIVGR